MLFQKAKVSRWVEAALCLYHSHSYSGMCGRCKCVLSSSPPEGDQWPPWREAGKLGLGAYLGPGSRELDQSSLAPNQSRALHTTLTSQAFQLLQCSQH